MLHDKNFDKNIWSWSNLNNKPKGLKVAKEDQRLIGLVVNRLNGLRDHLRDQEIGIMADWLDSERPRGFDFRQTDRH